MPYDSRIHCVKWCILYFNESACPTKNAHPMPRLLETAQMLGETSLSRENNIIVLTHYSQTLREA